MGLQRESGLGGRKGKPWELEVVGQLHLAIGGMCHGIMAMTAAFYSVGTGMSVPVKVNGHLFAKARQP